MYAVASILRVYLWRFATSGCQPVVGWALMMEETKSVYHPTSLYILFYNFN